MLSFWAHMLSFFTCVLKEFVYFLHFMFSPHAEILLFNIICDMKDHEKDPMLKIFLSTILL